MTFPNRKFAFALVVGQAFGPWSPAFAHAHFANAIPAPDGLIAVSPDELRLIFTEGVEPRFSSVKLIDAGGAEVPLAPAASDPAHHDVLVSRLTAPLKPGVCRVEWRAVAADTHKSQGQFTFALSP